MKKRNHIHIITGDFHQGKTSFAQEVATLLMNDGIEVSGFLSIGVFKDGKRHSFDLVNIANQEQKPLCSADEIQGWKKFRKFYFNLETISWGNEILKKATGSKVIVIDEIGPLELQREGWSEGMNAIIDQNNCIQIWVVRDILVKEILEIYSIPECNVFDITKHSPNELFSIIKPQLLSK